MLAVTAAILVLAYFSTRWIGRLGASEPLGALGDPRLCVLRQLRLGKDERLVLARLGERCLLLGVAAGGVTLLLELAPEEAAMWLEEREHASAAGQPSFLEVLKKSWPGKK